MGRGHAEECMRRRWRDWDTTARHIHTHTRARTRTHTHAHTRSRISVYTYIYVYIYTHTRTHTQTHTHIHRCTAAPRRATRINIAEALCPHILITALDAARPMVFKSAGGTLRHISLSSGSFPSSSQLQRVSDLSLVSSGNHCRSDPVQVQSTIARSRASTKQALAPTNGVVQARSRSEVGNEPWAPPALPSSGSAACCNGTRTRAS